MTTHEQTDLPLIVEGPLSDNERLKRESNFLRGTIAEDLQDQITGGFSPDNFQLIRFHGMYQQDDRDIRAERAQQKLEPLINVMVRARVPGGVITPEQWLAVEDWAEKHTMYGSVRLTTRQTFQFHGVFKPEIKDTHQAINAVGIDSIATAGDVNRNVLCSTNPMESQLHAEVYDWVHADLRAPAAPHQGLRRDLPRPRAGPDHRGAGAGGDLPAPQVQDHRVPAAGQRGRRQRQRPQLRGDRRGRRAGRLERPRRRRPGDDPRRHVHLPPHRGRLRLHPAGAHAGRRRARRHRAARLGQPGQPQERQDEVHPSTGSAPTSSRPRSSAGRA